MPPCAVHRCSCTVSPCPTNAATCTNAPTDPGVERNSCSCTETRGTSVRSVDSNECISRGITAANGQRCESYSTPCAAQPICNRYQCQSSLVQQCPTGCLNAGLPQPAVQRAMKATCYQFPANVVFNPNTAQLAPSNANCGQQCRDSTSPCPALPTCTTCQCECTTSGQCYDGCGLPSVASRAAGRGISRTTTCQCKCSDGSTDATGSRCSQNNQQCPVRAPRIEPCPVNPPCETFRCYMQRDPCPSGCKQPGAPDQMSYVRTGCFSQTTNQQVAFDKCNDGDGCPAPEPTPCTQPVCPQYECTYSETGSCSSATCGASGVRQRVGRCMVVTPGSPFTPATNQRACNNGNGCPSQPLPCPSLPCCPTFACPEANAGPWSSCSTTCGAGTMTRSIQCVKQCGGQPSVATPDDCARAGVACPPTSRPCQQCNFAAAPGAGFAPPMAPGRRSSHTRYQLRGNQCVDTLNSGPVPSTLCAHLAPAPAQVNIPAAVPDASKSLVTALSVCGGLMVVVALVASGVVVSKHVINKRVRAECEALGIQE